MFDTYVADQPKCMACQKPITYRFALCSACESTYGHTAAEWPSWLRFMWADEQKERRRILRIRKWEVPYEDDPEEEPDCREE